MKSSKSARIAVIVLCIVLVVAGIGILIGGRQSLPVGVDGDDPAVSGTGERAVTTAGDPSGAVTQPPASETTSAQSTASETTSAEPPETEITSMQPPASDMEQSDPPEPEGEESSKSECGSVRICLGGDTSIDTEFADAAVKWGVNYPWKEVIDIFSSADIAAVNLETCVSNRGESEKPEGLGFRTPPEMLEGFVNAGIDIVNLANNHTRDFGYDALLDTLDHLEEYGIGYFGAGRDIDEAQSLYVKEVNGVKVGFAGCNYVWLSSDCAAGEDHAGINMVYSISDERTQAFLKKVSEYDSQCDVLIVFMHCGVEEVFYTNSYQESLSRALIDNGADIVVGAHPHTIQPIEFYKGKPIFYSIGNLIFWHVDDDIDGLTCIFDITVDKNGFKSLKLHPLFIKNYKVYLLDKEEDSARYYQIIELVNDLCNPYGLAFDDDGNMIEYIEPEDGGQEAVATEAAVPEVTAVP